MRKSFRKILILSSAAVMAFGAAFSFAGCDKKFTPLEGDYSSAAEAVSNGGFVVEYGKYVYFVNGMESYTADNTYGTPVKGALMRVEKSALKANPNEAKAETVIPSLMVSADYTAGLFIYGDRVYYATPNNVKNMTGEIESGYLDFKSAKLDGSDIRSYFRVESNSTVFRYVRAEGADTVYLVYHEDSTLHSYNTDTKADTVLVKDLSSTAYALNASDKTCPYIYYTMGVQDELDGETSVPMQYNQIYRVRADATEAPYEYVWDEEYLEENDGEAPYTNLGELVLDGIGQSAQTVTQFTHDLDKLTDAQKKELPPVGYSYTLVKYDNGGVYFTRKDLTSSEGANLYYLAESRVNAEAWNSISGNVDNFDTVANASKTANTTATSLFYKNDAGEHSYIYVKDENIIRAYANADGSAREQEVCFDASGATLVSLDTTSDSKYDYVWFTRSNGSGYSVERAVINGEAKDYGVLDYNGKDDNYKPVKFLDLQHTGNWYPYEIVGDMLFIADAEPIGSTSYGYIAYLSLADKNGAFMTNTDVEKINDAYNEIISTDAKVGYIAKIRDDGDSALANALTYYFKTGERTAFDGNIQKAVDAGKKDTYLYTEDVQNAFKAFVEKTGETAEMFQSGRTRSDFIAMLGARSEADEDAISTYWSDSYLEHYTAPAVEDEGLEDWEWALIGVAIGIVVIGAGVAAYLIVRRKKRKAHKDDGDEGFRVDTTDDRDVDVYTQAENVGKDETAPAENDARESAENAAQETRDGAEESGGSEE